MKKLTDNNPMNPEAGRLHLEFIALTSNNNVAAPGQKIFFPHIPILESGQIVGIIATSALGGPFGQTGNISNDTIIPASGFSNVSVFNYLTELFVTIVNKNGETLFNSIPYSTLFPFDGKVKPYNAVNIDTRRCFFSFPAGTLISGNETAGIGFYIKKFD
jgi:hypothetical protein